MAAPDEILARIISCRPFAVLGYSAEDAVWCPRCLRSAAGLSPGQLDSAKRPIVPLYARDGSVREEVCDNCERPLLDIFFAKPTGSPAPRPVTAQLRIHGKRTALDFDRVPPIDVRTTLKASGWRWDPRFRLWWSVEASPPIPAGVVILREIAAAAQPRPPVVRRNTSKR